jgi:hypothetical protein
VDALASSVRWDRPAGDWAAPSNAIADLETQWTGQKRTNAVTGNGWMTQRVHLPVCLHVYARRKSRLTGDAID